MSNAIRILVCSILASLLMTGVAAAQTVTRIDVLDFGLYSATTNKQQAAPGSAAGTMNIVGNIAFYQHTDKVPARVGTRFGVKYAVVGSPDGAEVELQVVWRLPEPGLRNPKTGNVYRETHQTMTRVIGDRDNVRGYSLDAEWELVPGNWTLELWSGDRKLASRTFTLYRP